MREQNATTRGTGLRRGFALTASVLVAALATATAAPGAWGETLEDLRVQADQAQVAAQTAQMEIAESQQNVNSATARLADSENALAHARSVLSDTVVQLAAARENDARLAAELRRAREELERARAEVVRAEAEVAAQRQVIVEAARESYQQQSGLTGLTVALGSETTAELSQRLQWNTTIFDTQAAEKSRLDEALVTLERARDAQAAIEARIAEDKAASAVTVARIADLERAATAQRDAVAALVAANEQARTAAVTELAADEAAFSEYQAEEDRLQREIQAEIARLRAEEEARRRAEEEAAARRAAEAARLAAEEAARASAPKAATQAAASASGSSETSGAKVSSTGFIRPIAARPGSRFGMRFHPILKYWRMHNGVDYGAPTGTPLYAAKTGTIVKAGPNGGFGNFVLIGHGDLSGQYVTTGYAHLSRIVVSVGQRVQRGELIGYVGSTGLSTTPHLHLEVRLDGVAKNPLLYIP